MADSLTCSRCPASAEFPLTAWRCPVCHGPLSWAGHRSFSRLDVDHGRQFVWRYGAALPVVAPAGAFGEVETPLTAVEIGGASLMAKLDFLTPSGSFKDRGFAVLMHALAMAGVRRVVEDSSGNAAASIAAYAARLGIRCTVYAPASASRGKLVQASAYGARVVQVEGSRADVARAAEEAHDEQKGIIYASHNCHPFFIAGVATWALAVWEQLGWQSPENVIVPAGSGSLVLGAHQAFSMLVEGGEIPHLPRIFAVQPENCAPLVRAMERQSAEVTPFDCRPTIAEGASIAEPVRGREVLAALRESGGGAVSATEQEIIDAALNASAQGLYIEPTSSLAIAGASQLLQSGTIDRTETTVLVLTGSGLKATETVEKLIDRSR